MMQSLEPQLRVQLALVALTLGGVFRVDPSHTLAAMARGYGEEPPEVRQWVAHMSPYDLALEWSDDPAVRDSEEAQSRYEQLTRSPVWHAVASSGALEETAESLVAQTSQVAAAYLSANPLASEHVPGLIEDIHNALVKANQASYLAQVSLLDQDSNVARNDMPGYYGIIQPTSESISNKTTEFSEIKTGVDAPRISAIFKHIYDVRSKNYFSEYKQIEGRITFWRKDRDKDEEERKEAESEKQSDIS